MNSSTSYDSELDQFLEWRLDEEEKTSKKFEDTSYIKTQDLPKWLLRLMSGRIMKIKSKDVKRYRSELDPRKEGKIEFGKLLEFVSKEMEKYDPKSNTLIALGDTSLSAKKSFKKSKKH